MHNSLVISAAASDEQLLQLLVSQLEEFVVVLTDKDGFFTSWHAGVENLFGFTADEFIGRHIDILFPLAERPKGSPNRELQIAREKGRASDTGWLVRKDGRHIFVEGVTVALRSANGPLAGFGKILRDVTARKHTDDELRTFSGALDQSAVIVRTWDGTIKHWTAGCEYLYGWAASDAIGKLCQELLQTKFPVPVQEIQNQLATCGSWKGELTHTRADGAELAISAFWVAKCDADGRPLLVIETQTDITDREKMRLELEQAHEQLKTIRDELERSNEELEEFARIASHDLGAPITSTRWLVDILQKRHGPNLGDDGQQCIDHIARSLARMADQVEGVLAHARAGREPITTFVHSDAGEAFAIAMENLQVDIEESGAAITQDPFPEVAVAPQALAQLFQNLLSNAIKYHQPGIVPHIRVSVSQQGSMWLFAFRDNGIGIEPEWYERIFQPMQRVGGLNVAGSGIGLATCRKIVRRAGGRIWVESQIGKGTTFLFTLPVVTKSSAAK